MSTRPTIRCTYWFDSSSSNAVYEALEFSDGSTSCGCKGWTRRCVNGIRTCKHVRIIQANLGRQMAKAFNDSGGVSAAPATVGNVKKAPPNTAPTPALGHRKMILN